jgi:hypothetical protein
LVTASRGRKGMSRSSKLAAVWEVSDQVAREASVLVTIALLTERSRSKDRMRPTGWRMGWMARHRLHSSSPPPWPPRLRPRNHDDAAGSNQSRSGEKNQFQFRKEIMWRRLTAYSVQRTAYSVQRTLYNIITRCMLCLCCLRPAGEQAILSTAGSHHSHADIEAAREHLLDCRGQRE